jgi:hypothetical protein
VKLRHRDACHTCGVPGVWARDFVHDGDNTSLQRGVPVRGVFYEAGEIEHLLGAMEETLGASPDRVVFNANKRAARLVLSSSLRGLTGSLARQFAPLIIYRCLADLAPDFGLGLVSITEYRRGGPLLVEAANVWDGRLLAADVAGAFEAVDGAECEVDTEQSGGAYRFTAQRSGVDKQDLVESPVPLTGALSGERAYPRCHECGAPFSFQEFSWNRESGDVRERDNGLRVVYRATAHFDALLREAAAGPGDELREKVIRAQADYVRDMIVSGAYDAGGGTRVDTGRKYFDYLGLIRRRCMGNPLDFEYGPGSLRVSIRSPGNKELIVGRVLGTFEGISGGKGLARSSNSGGMLRVKVLPA